MDKALPEDVSKICKSLLSTESTTTTVSGDNATLSRVTKSGRKPWNFGEHKTRPSKDITWRPLIRSNFVIFVINNNNNIDINNINNNNDDDDDNDNDNNNDSYDDDDDDDDNDNDSYDDYDDDDDDDDTSC